MTSFGRSLELFFIDGRPDGMLTAEVFDWTGHVLRIPRTQIAQGIARKEAKHTGVYLLLGEANDRPLAYVGEGEDVAERLRSHVTNKDWWETAIVVTSAANNLNKAHVKYLESRLVEIATDVGGITLDNNNIPPRSSLSEAATANMESFLNTLNMVLPAIRVDIFQQKAKPKSALIAPTNEAATAFEIVSRKLSGTAKALLMNGEMIVQAGSVARADWVGVDASYTKLRQDLIENGTLVVSDEGTVFSQNYAFASPSAAAAVILGRSANGRTEWKLADQNKTYAQWESEQVIAGDAE
ncbi:GIY-YIG nuclease family protein [Thalassovita sp.]|uniref:GIY-YIG nuclease family protein n=1 Tax=Thalassovita sp. TaxID=1979401 RepID=UPI002882679F|nr:GIY-YIG nuclease family protein [Thalassovita sp.]MDF1801650.1 GIY-YIG nuclease family protein [Thalassovita sp.]